MIAKISNKVRRLNSLRVWSVITGVALVAALVLTLAPLGVGINTNGLISINLSQVGANPGWLEGWDYRISHNLTGATGAGTDYQVELLIGSKEGTGLFREQDRVTINYPNDLDVYSGGNRTITAGWAEALIRLYDTSDKTDITQIDSIAITHPHDVKLISGNSDFAYYCTYDNDTFGILNLTNEENLSIADSVSCTNAFYVCPVLIGSRKIVFVVTYDEDKLHIFDVTDEEITLLDTFSGYDTNYDVRTSWRVKYHAEYQLAILGAATNGTGAVSVFDVSDPDNVTPIVKYTGADYRWGNLFIEGNKVYGTASLYDKVVVCSIAANGTLTKLGEYQSSEYLDGCHGISVENSIIYAVSWAGADLTILDATDPESISYVTSYSDPTLYTAHACYKSGDYIWYACADCDTVAIFKYAPDIHLEGYCTDFPNDIRFTDDDGETELKHWCEDLTADPATFHIKVVDDLGSDQTIYVYCGKSGQSSASNGTDTFLFFDDFAGESLDGDKWTTIQGDVSIDSGALKLTGTAGTRGLIDGITSIPLGSAIHTRVKSDTNDVFSDLAHICSLRKSLDWAYRVEIIGYSTSANRLTFYTIDNGSDTPTTNVAVNDCSEYHEYSATWVSGQAKFYQDTTLKATHTTNVPSVDLVVAFYEAGAVVYNAWCDWVFVRKYVYPEPAHGGWGEWETEGECSPSIELNISSWSINSGNPIAESSNYATDLTYFTVTNNNSGGAIDITIGGSDMTGGGYTWDLADNGSPGDMIYGLYAGLSGGDYTIIVKESAPYNTLVSSLANNDDQDFGLKIYTPTNFDDGNPKSGGITLTVVCS